MSFMAKHRQLITSFFIFLLTTSLLFFIAPKQAEAQEAQGAQGANKSSEEYKEFIKLRESDELKEFDAYKANETYPADKYKKMVLRLTSALATKPL